MGGFRERARGFPRIRRGELKDFIDNHRKVIALAAAAAGIALAVAGILGGGAESVVEKATLICMECIGIG